MKLQESLIELVCLIALCSASLDAFAQVSALDLCTTNQDCLGGFWTAVEKGNDPVTIVSFGDSMAASGSSIGSSMMDRFVACLRTAGYAFDNYRNTMMGYTTNGAFDLAQSAFWFMKHFQLPPGGGVFWLSQVPPTGVMCDSLGLYYVAQPAGGALALSVSTNGGPWGRVLTVDGYSPTPVGRFTNILLHLDRHRLLVESLTGTNIVLGPQALDSSSHGVKVTFINQSGIPLEVVTNVPLSIRVPIFQALNPKLLIWHMKEPIGDETRVRLEECEAWWSNAVPNMNVVYVGTPYMWLDTNSSNTIDQNTIVRSIALKYHRAYVDCMNPSVSYPWLVQQGYISTDGCHLTLPGDTCFSNIAWNDLGFYALGAPRALAIERNQGSVNLHYATTNGIIYTLEASTNLFHWQSLSSVPGDSGPDGGACLRGTGNATRRLASA